MTKVQAKKFIKEKPVIEDKFKDLINTGPKLDSDENKFSDKPKKQYDGPDNRYRLSEKIDDRFDSGCLFVIQLELARFIFRSKNET